MFCKLKYFVFKPTKKINITNKLEYKIVKKNISQFFFIYYTTDTKQ